MLIVCATVTIALPTDYGLWVAAGYPPIVCCLKEDAGIIGLTTKVAGGIAVTKNFSQIPNLQVESSESGNVSSILQLKCVGPYIWNNMPTDIRKISRIALLKKKIRSCNHERNQITL